MFQILSPLKNITEIKPLINAWADDFYAWFVYKDTNSLNDRPNLKTYNFESLDELSRWVQLIHELWKKIYITLNTLDFPISEFKKLEKIIINMSPDAIIVSDINLIDYLSEINFPIPIHLSTIIWTSNNETIQYFSENYKNIKRVCLERTIWYNSLKKIVKNDTPIETEFFVFSWHCRYVEWACHLDYLAKFENNIWSACNLLKAKTGNDLKNNLYSKNESCAFCNISDLYKSLKDKWIEKNLYLKIEWRDKKLDYKIKIISELKKVIDLIKNWKSNKKILKEAYKNITWHECNQFINCYYN